MGLVYVGSKREASSYQPCLDALVQSTSSPPPVSVQAPPSSRHRGDVGPILPPCLAPDGERRLGAPRRARPAADVAGVAPPTNACFRILHVEVAVVAVVVVLRGRFAGLLIATQRLPLWQPLPALADADAVPPTLFAVVPLPVQPLHDRSPAAAVTPSDEPPPSPAAPPTERHVLSPRFLAAWPEGLVVLLPRANERSFPPPT